MQICGFASDFTVLKITRALVTLLTIQGVGPLVHILPFFYITSFSTNSLGFYLCFVHNVTGFIIHLLI